MFSVKNIGGNYSIDCTLNGDIYHGISFYVDTGSDITVFSSKLLDNVDEKAIKNKVII